MSQKCEKLFSPIRIGTLELKNRIVMVSHSAGFSMDPHEQNPGQQVAEYMARRAEGGAALVCLGSMYGLAYAYNAGGGRLGYRIGNMIFNWDAGQSDTTSETAFRAYMGRIANTVHDAGGKIFALLDMGPQRTTYGYFRITQVDYLALSASQTSDRLSAVTARELEPGEIESLVKAAGQLAAVISDTGIDGIELHAHAGFLHGQFMSPGSNFRSDEYGGSLENRMRFTMDTLEELRLRVGSDYPISLRLSPREDCEGGLRLSEGVEMARRFEERRLVDLISVSVAPTTKGLVTPDMSYPPALWADVAGAVRAAMRHDTPVLCVGRIGDPLLAERILTEGKADVIGMVRPLIADPDLPNKAKEGRFTDIRQCTFSSEGCLSLLTSTSVKEVTCTVNPETGHEREYKIAFPVTRIKKVVVVGGGPAGLKAAEQAAERGHKVVLFDKNTELGGQVTLQARVESRARERVVTDYLENRLRNLNVEVRTLVAATSTIVMDEMPDVVVLATGAYPIRTEFTNLTPALPGLPGAERSFVLTGADVLNGKDVGPRVVLVEDSSGGDFKAPLIAEYLLGAGREVLVLTTADTLGHFTNMVNHQPMLRRLYSYGMKIRSHTGVREIREHSLITYNVHSNFEDEVDGFDSVVLELGYRTDRQLFKSLVGLVPELYEVGDAVQPRSVTAAILEGFKTGRRL